MWASMQDTLLVQDAATHCHSQQACCETPKQATTVKHVLPASSMRCMVLCWCKPQTDKTALTSSGQTFVMIKGKYRWDETRRMMVGTDAGGVTCMANEPAPGVLEGWSTCQVHGQPLEGLVPFAPLGAILVKGIEGQQLVGSHTGCQPGLFESGDALDAGIHDLVSALGDAGDDSQHRVRRVTTQRGLPRTLCRQSQHVGGPSYAYQDQS